LGRKQTPATAAAGKEAGKMKLESRLYPVLWAGSNPNKPG
jgi:hypothetical protein